QAEGEINRFCAGAEIALSDEPVNGTDAEDVNERQQEASDYETDQEGGARAVVGHKSHPAHALAMRVVRLYRREKWHGCDTMSQQGRRNKKNAGESLPT